MGGGEKRMDFDVKRNVPVFLSVEGLNFVEFASLDMGMCKLQVAEDDLDKVSLGFFCE